MEVSGQHHAPVALPPEKELRCPLDRGLGGPIAGLDVVGKREVSFPCRDLNLGLCSPQRGPGTDHAIADPVHSRIHWVPELSS